MSEQRKSVHDGWTPQPHEQPQPGDPLATAPSTPEHDHPDLVESCPQCWDDADEEGHPPSTPEPGIEQLRAAIGAALNELGVPNEGYPAPVANAVAILREALAAGTTGRSPRIIELPPVDAMTGRCTGCGGRVTREGRCACRPEDFLAAAR